MADIDLISVPLLGWPFSVLSTLSSPPGSPTLNECHIVGSSPTGAWSGHTNAIARWNASSAWEFQTPSTGRRIYDIGAVAWKQWSGSAWTGDAGPLPAGGSTDQVLAKLSGTDYNVGWTSNHDVPAGGSTGQQLTKTSGADYAVAWSTLSGTGPTQVWFFASSGSLTNISGVIGDIAIVGGSVVNLYYKDASNVWVLGGPIAASAGGTITGVTAGNGISGGGTSGTVTVNVDVHSATLKATPTTSDELLIADVSASNAIKRITVGSLPFTGTITGVTAGTAITGGGTSGTVTVNVDLGTSGSQACAGNDARLSDSRNPIIHTQTLKGTPVSADEIVIADSAASFAPKRATIGSLPAAGSATSITESSGPTALAVGAVADGDYFRRSGSTVVGASVSGFSVLSDVNPLHYWKASGTVQTSGLVDQITDVGRSPKHFTQTGTPRCPTATDGNGKTYLAPDGTTDYYQAGVAADWSFMQQGAPFTIGMVYHVPTDPGATGYLLSTFSGSGASEGFWLLNARSSSTVWGPYYSLYKTGTGTIITADFRKANLTGIMTLAIVHFGDSSNTITGANNLIWQATMFAQGKRVQNTSKTASYPAITPQAPLTLFSNSTPGGYFGGRLYECWIDDTAQPDWAIHEWMKSARAAYAAT